MLLIQLKKSRHNIQGNGHTSYSTSCFLTISLKGKTQTEPLSLFHCQWAKSEFGNIRVYA